MKDEGGQSKGSCRRDELERRLLFILHCGLVEARNLALSQRHMQISELADALELIPSYLDRRRDEDLDAIRFSLTKYREGFPESPYDYLRYFESEVPPAF
jgi:hypothetical protein